MKKLFSLFFFLLAGVTAASLFLGPIDDCTRLSETLRDTMHISKYSDLQKSMTDLFRYDISTVKNAVATNDSSLIGGIPIPIADAFVKMDFALEHSEAKQ